MRTTKSLLELNLYFLSKIMCKGFFPLQMGRLCIEFQIQYRWGVRGSLINIATLSLNYKTIMYTVKLKRPLSFHMPLKTFIKNTKQTES